MTTDSNKCSGCGVSKPLSVYYTKGSHHDSRCKECTLTEKKRRRSSSQQQPDESHCPEDHILPDGSRVYTHPDGQRICLSATDFQEFVKLFETSSNGDSDGSGDGDSDPHAYLNSSVEPSAPTRVEGSSFSSPMGQPEAQFPFEPSASVASEASFHIINPCHNQQ